MDQFYIATNEFILSADILCTNVLMNVIMQLRFICFIDVQ